MGVQVTQQVQAPAMLSSSATYEAIRGCRLGAAVYLPRSSQVPSGLSLHTCSLLVSCHMMLL